MNDFNLAYSSARDFFMTPSQDSIDNKVNLDDFSKSISENGYFVNNLAFNSTTIEPIKALADYKKTAGDFKPAKIGRSASLHTQQKIRGDESSWILNWENSSLEPLRCLFSVLVEKARYELFQSTKSFESQFAFYPPGAAYHRHVDCHLGERHRILTVILYIGIWKEGDGGELYIYPKNQVPIKISPTAGKLVVFKSEMEHEVMATLVNRWSITTWIRDDEL